ncbi:hypothetical protein DKP63_23950 [Salmonella enterica subsp. enterica serovar London]|nr:hypothetical protein [Salmonella enterica subsp. enterica serovar London]
MRNNNKIIIRNKNFTFDEKNHKSRSLPMNTHEQSLNTALSTLHLLTSCIINFFIKVNSSE